MTAYYNEIDPYAAQWLRNLILAGHIAYGDVDTRSIEDVSPKDLSGYRQCHFFAGIGVWSYALRRAGWGDELQVWTGSCPCQPFSAAGKGAGFADERHLWPSWHYLIEKCKPGVIFGEQVASRDAEPWIDLVQDDLEALGYAFGAVAFPAAGIGAPHIRDRTYWVAYADDAGSQGRRRAELRKCASELAAGAAAPFGGLGQPNSAGPQPRRVTGTPARHGGPADAAGGVGGVADMPQRGRREERPYAGRLSAGNSAERRPAGLGHGGGTGGLADAESGGRPREPLRTPGGGSQDRNAQVRDLGNPNPTNGIWRGADWLLCRDGKWRPVEPGTFPLAHGAPARVGRLRAYGNAIVAAQAEEFIRAAMSCMP